VRETGACDEHTWRALVEASWRLGDRLLVLTSPNLRGDDVAELQSRLARIGFDCGRVDGIFGPQTSQALADFQANCGLAADGVCGQESLAVLHRVSGQTGSGPGVATLRDRERLRDAPPSLASLRVVVGQFGGLSTITRHVARDLRAHGAKVVSLDEPDAVAQAQAANHFAAHVYVGLESSTSDESIVHHYRVPTFESLGGRALASWLARELRGAGLRVADACGMRLPVLRETRMPAVLMLLGPVQDVTAAAPEVAAAIVAALRGWAVAPSVTVG